ncbi:hypothetical protein LCGC14_2229160 [marine sediment metagenome]|uniref:Uncharacterized protein n=1 Tax=marine sediment metagenome TaxID=412755 RepID=A0A0F9G3Z1_9ZZZZ
MTGSLVDRRQCDSNVFDLLGLVLFRHDVRVDFDAADPPVRSLREPEEFISTRRDTIETVAPLLVGEGAHRLSFPINLEIATVFEQRHQHHAAIHQRTLSVQHYHRLFL